VCAGFCVGDCDFGDAGDGGAGMDGSICVEQAAVAVVGVFAETDVACDEERREELS
jgi:hypothetical protein